MKLIFAIFIFFSLLVHASEDSFFTNEDPSVFQNVNVISGHLNLSFDDGMVRCARPFSLFRTYSSSGALEFSSDRADLSMFYERQGYLVQGGWNFLPHTNIFIKTGKHIKNCKVYAFEPEGGVIEFSYETTECKYNHVFKAKQSHTKGSGSLSGKKDQSNYKLFINFRKGEALIVLGDGGTRFYKLKIVKDGRPIPPGLNCWNLREEQLSTKEKIVYEYDDKTRLKEIKITSPSGKRVYGKLNFKFKSKQCPYPLQITTSDGKTIEYLGHGFEDREYLKEARNSAAPHQIIKYTPSRKKKGLRLKELFYENQLQLRVHYYSPPDKKSERDWAHPNRKTDHITDKVSAIEAPFGENGEMVQVASYKYYETYTDVRDANNILTRYHHDGHVLSKVEYFDKNESLYSTLAFTWDNKRLKSKALLNNEGSAVFAKSFEYDDRGNVVKEILFGNLTGRSSKVFQIDETGNPLSLETFTKAYEYHSQTNDLALEKEESGLNYKYIYKENTSLLLAKFTLKNDRILRRELFDYDDEHLLIAKTIDDCNSEDLSCFQGASIRSIFKYTNSLEHGLPIALYEGYWDFKENQEKPLITSKYFYNKQNLVVKEEVYDSKGSLSYTLFTDYNKSGKVVRKTTPLSQENTYHYDHLDRLIETKEVGQPKKQIIYDSASRPVVAKEISSNGEVKTTLSKYDKKNKVISQIDARGNLTSQEYDEFGRCFKTAFPLAKDETENLYTPEVYFSYDIEGNLISDTTPNGVLTKVTYNLYKKPILIEYADGSCIQHYYKKNGLLAQTVYVDGTSIFYSYDDLNNLLAKAIYSEQGTLLSEEKWTYDAFKLLSYTNERGLTTYFSYDNAGRKIKEEANGRSTSFEYDALGFLCKTLEGDIAFIQVHDAGGRITEQKEEDCFGNTINQMWFYYNEENHKIKAERLTSQGIVIDRFIYDDYGKMLVWEDPYHAKTYYKYDENYANDLGQKVLQKTTVDPLGNKKLETFDALERLVSIEKKDVKNRTVAFEEYYYDRDGNKAKTSSTIFKDFLAEGKTEICSHFDRLGRVIKLIEGGQKITSYAYDLKGRVKEKTSPNGTILFCNYDGLDRLLSLKSSDGSINYEYTYGHGKEPTFVIDKVNNKELKRDYNLFGEMVYEKDLLGNELKWDYDNLGRNTEFILPDQSKIAKEFEGLFLKKVARYDFNDNFLYCHTYIKYDPNGHVEEEILLNNLGFISTFHDKLERPILQQSQWLKHSAKFNEANLVIQTFSSLYGKKEFSYDALNQLTKENEKAYQFDSLGNPTDALVNELNQILSKEDMQIVYDENGNPIKRTQNEEVAEFEYDALNRLRGIIYPNTKKVIFYYDAFSRLLSKQVYISKNGAWINQEERFYLYDKQEEIGECDSEGFIKELKIQGIGIKGGIGATVACEINGNVYAVLNDLAGNSVALIDPSGEIVESYNFSAFGEEISSSETKINPWRFSSKRHIEGFIYFGERFYDVKLARWWTPDPSGFSDGPNLYIYVLNSPLNRLDLFGLLSEEYFPSQSGLFVPMSDVKRVYEPGSVIACKGFIGEVEVDWLVSCGHFHKLQFSPEEIKADRINLLDHFSELMPSEGMIIGLVTAQNGIDTTLEEFAGMSKSITSKIPEGTLFIGLHNPTQGIFVDMLRARAEIKNIVETPIVAQTRHFMAAVVERIHKINPKLLWQHVPHSEGGAIARRSLEGLTPEQKTLMKEHLMVFALGPALPISNQLVRNAVNIYSDKDYVTKGYAKPYINDNSYTIRMLNCITPRNEMNFYFADHGLLGNTYQEATKDQFVYLKNKYGFFNEK